MAGDEVYVTSEFPWVVVASWHDSGVTVHGGWRTAEAADAHAAAAWSDHPRCQGWRVVQISDPPVARRRVTTVAEDDDELGDGFDELRAAALPEDAPGAWVRKAIDRERSR